MGYFLKPVVTVASYLRYVILLAYTLLTVNSCQSQTTILSDDFSDNHLNWEEDTNARECAFIKNGKYFIKTFDANIWHWFSIPSSIRNDRNWIIEADVYIDTVKTKNGYLGILWGAKDANNMLQARFYPNKQIADGIIISKEKGEELFPSSRVNIVDSSKVRFTLLKANGSYFYLLNDIPVDKSKTYPLFGNKVGFVAAGMAEISVDHFTIRELESNSSVSSQIENTFSKILDADGNVKHEWGYYYNLANSLLEKGDTANSLKMIDKSDSSVRDEFYSVDTLEYWRHRNPIASFLIHAGEISKAKFILEKCITAFKNADSVYTSIYPVLLSNMALCNSRINNFNLAIKYYNDALKLREKMFGWKDERTLKSAKDIIAVNEKAGEIVNSKSVFLEILQGLKQSLGEMNEKYFSVSDDYAVYLLEMGKNSTALQLLKQTLVNRQKLYVDTPYRLIPSYHFIGKTYWQMDDYDSAEQYFYQANILAKKYRIANWIPTTEIALGEIYRLQDRPKQALKTLLPFYHKNEKNPDAVWLSNNIGSTYFDMGKYKIALKYFSDCEKFANKHFEFYLRQRRRELIATEYHMSDTYFQLRKLADAHVYAGFMVETVFLELNENKDILSEADYFSFLNLYKENIFWFNFLSSLETHYFKSSGRIISDGEIFKFNELFHLPKKISVENEYFKKLLYFDDSLLSYMDTLDKKLIEGNAAYIRIVKFPLIVEKGYGYLAIIKRGNNAHVFLERIDITSTLDSIFTSTQKALILQKPTDITEFKMFWSKIEPHLKGEKKIYIAPDGIFNKLNIEAMLIQDSLGHECYLGDIYNIVVVNSSREIFHGHTIPDTSKTITLFGYPDYTLNKKEQIKLVKQIGIDSTALADMRGSNAVTGTYSFEPLIATKHEVEDIAQFMQQRGWHTQVFTGSSALEETLKKIQSPRVLHIATHGFFAEDIQSNSQKDFMGMDLKIVTENPLLRCGLAFAGAERTRTDTSHELLQGIEDGILTGEEAQYLHLSGTELVVLSACETGLGEIVNGEGVYGLQRAFRAAGAKSILMSLWKVDDAATETLMKNFYQHWLEDGMNKHDALWQAKLDLRNDKNHPLWALPYYWGAFVLIGE